MIISYTDDLREKVPVKIAKGAGLEKTINELFRNFEAGEQRNAELVNRFFNQTYFTGEESLINKFIEVKPDIKFDDIKDEGINLAVLMYNDGLYNFKLNLDKIRNDNIKKKFIKEIHDKVRAIIGTGAPYDHFDDPTECAVVTGDTNVIGYLQKVFDYLEKRENVTNGKKVKEILKDVIITNNDLNSALPAGENIPTGVNLTDPSVPTDTKNDFDTLLSFEIGKEADRTISIARNFSKNFQNLLTNSLPAINTVIGESEEYKYDEGKLGPEYEGRAQSIRNNTSLSGKDKDKQIKDLKREYYIKYLKTKNANIGNALEQLYNNDFDYSKIERSVLKDYFDKVADIRLQMLFDKGINEYLKLDWGNVDEFKAFYKNLTDVDPANPTLNITLSDVNVPGSSPRVTGLINIPVQRKLVEGPNKRLKDDIEQFGKGAEKSFDSFPMEFTINKSDINALNINIEDRTKLLNLLSKYDQGDKYEIKGENIGTLIYLFFSINNRLPITDLDPKGQKEIEDLFGKAKKHKSGPENTDIEGGEYTSQKFKEEIEKLGPGKFENGSEIWIPSSKSELPGGGYQWMKIKISNLNLTEGTFTGTVFGGELKFGDYEGKSKEFKMDKETLEKFKATSRKVSNTEDNVRLQPNPDKSDFNSFRERLNGKLGTNTFSFPVEGVTWNGNKFMQIVNKNGKEKEVEVKYFGASADDKSTYKIEYNPIRKSFTVSSSFNGDEKGKNGKTEKKRFSYKRDMDWNNFLIFFTQKGLHPQTEEESNDAIIRQDNEFKIANGGHRKINWFTINNIKHGFKDIFGALKKKIDEYNKKQDEKFRKSVESPILNALGALPLLPPSLKSAIGERQQEIYNEELNGAWPEIEKYLKALQSDGQFADTFDQVPPHVQTLYGKSYQKFIIDLRDKGETSTEEKRKAAALLLANYEKGGSPFRGLTDYENQGLWVKILLGKDHYQQFLRDKAACVRDRDLAETSKESGLDKKGLNEQLATCEMDYIINNVRGAYPKLPNSYFPSHESRGINGNKSTSYIPNPSKILLSETFANKLEDAKKGRFTKDSVNDAYTKNKSFNRFEVMEDEFGKMGSARYKQGAGALRRMFDLASDESLKRRAKKHFLTYLLSGVLDVNCDPGLKKQVYGWAKPMSFVPGMLVKEAGVAENIAILLDDATNGDFSRNVTKYFHRNKQLKGGIDFKGLQGEINKWLTNEQMDKLDLYFSKLPTNNFQSVTDPKKKAILLKFKKGLVEEDVEEFDRGLLDNPKMVNNGLLTSINVISDRLSFDDGEFKGNDSDDISNKKSFWNNVQKDIEQRNARDENDVNFVLNKYFNRFGLSSIQDRQDTYQWIKTAYHRKPGIGKNVKFRYKGNILDMGKITNNEIKDIIRYTFKGRVMKNRFSARRLPIELDQALDQFQKFFEEAFDNNIMDKPIVESDAFKSKGKQIEIMPLGSNTIYKEVLSGDNDYTIDDGSGDDEIGTPKQYRKARQNAFRNGGFINHEMAQIEKYFKNRLPSNAYRPITKNTYNDINQLVELL